MAKGSAKHKNFKLSTHGQSQERVILFVILAVVLGFVIGWMFRNEFILALGGVPTY